MQVFKLLFSCSIHTVLYSNISYLIIINSLLVLLGKILHFSDVIFECVVIIVSLVLGWCCGYNELFSNQTEQFIEIRYSKGFKNKIY